MRVSVIIPSYNRDNLVGETIENMLLQTLPPHEVIVIDDGSTDNSVAVVRSFGDKVKLLQQPNQGPGTARNAGLRIATGDFIQFMDSDDLFTLNKLQVQAQKLVATGSDIAFSPWAKMSFNNQQVILENQVLQQAMPSDRIPLLSWYLRGWSTVFQTLMFRHSFIKNVGFYRTDLMPTEDIEFFVRILLHKPKITFSDACMTLYRIHPYAKISAEGTALNKRIIDWGNYLRQTCRNLDEAHYHPDYLTRMIFKVVLMKSYEELQPIQETSPELLTFLQNRIKPHEIALLQMLAFYQRGLGHLLGRFKGSRWIEPYQVNAITEDQKKLITELGFHF